MISPPPKNLLSEVRTDPVLLNLLTLKLRMDLPITLDEIGRATGYSLRQVARISSKVRAYLEAVSPQPFQNDPRSIVASALELESAARGTTSILIPLLLKPSSSRRIKVVQTRLIEEFVSEIGSGGTWWTEERS